LIGYSALAGEQLSPAVEKGAVVCAPLGSVRKIATLRELQETLAVLPGSHSHSRSHSSHMKVYGDVDVFDLLVLAASHPFWAFLHADLLAGPVQVYLDLVVQLLAALLVLLPVALQAFHLILH